MFVQIFKAKLYSLRYPTVHR